jgi:chromosome segregation ATPase
MGYQLNPQYSSTEAVRQDRSATASPQLAQIAEPTLVNQGLLAGLESLRQRYQELEVAYQTIEREKQQLQLAYNELEQRLIACTAKLELTNRTGVYPAAVGHCSSPN